MIKSIFCWYWMALKRWINNKLSKTGTYLIFKRLNRHQFKYKNRVALTPTNYKHSFLTSGSF